MAEHPLLVSLGNKPRTGIVAICVCNKEFYVSPSMIRTHNYCSRRCSADALYKSLPKSCMVCGKEYRTPVSQEVHRGVSKYCSNKCKGTGNKLFRSGKNSPGWRGGVSSENHRIRQSREFADWRKAVFERDDYTCVSCGKHGGYLEPDHIKPFAYFPDDRFDIANGRTLCKPCHKKTDTYGVKAKRLYGTQRKT